MARKVFTVFGVWSLAIILVCGNVSSKRETAEASCDNAELVFTSCIVTTWQGFRTCLMSDHSLPTCAKHNTSNPGFYRHKKDEHGNTKTTWVHTAFCSRAPGCAIDDGQSTYVGVNCVRDEELIPNSWREPLWEPCVPSSNPEEEKKNPCTVPGCGDTAG
jgi:hypothetical protein